MLFLREALEKAHHVMLRDKVVLTSSVGMDSERVEAERHADLANETDAAASDTTTMFFFF